MKELVTQMQQDLRFTLLRLLLNMLRCVCTQVLNIGSLTLYSRCLLMLLSGLDLDTAENIEK
jgi:hypothetical protein